MSNTSNTLPPSATRRTSAQSPIQRTIQRVRNWWERQYRRTSATSLREVPLLLTLIALGLTSFGVIMVLSASSVEQIAQGLSPFSQVSRQGIYALIGLVGMAVVAFIPVQLYRRGTVLNAAIILAIVVQLLTAFIGVDVGGNRNWINLGFMQVQPSEFSKLVLALWGSWVLMNQGDVRRRSSKAFFPLLIGAGLLILFILAGHDVGTVMVYGIMLLGMLWFAGLNRKGILIGFGVTALAAAIAVFSSPNRMARIMGTLGSCQGATCDQSNAGLAALATGGFWGVGLGRSRQKYNYLPEAHNDYIFAVVGEELGLIGTLLIILLYLGFVYCCIRIMLRTSDRFIALTTGAIMMWLMGQATINIAMVAGLLPVIGIPLPLISYGGSSLITSLIAIGVLIAFARQTPLMPLTVDEVSYTSDSAQPDMHDEKRRRSLSAIVAQDNKRLDRAGENAGWDIKVFWNNLRAGANQVQQRRRGTSHTAQPRRAGTRPVEPRPSRSPRSAQERMSPASAPAPRTRTGAHAGEPQRKRTSAPQQRSAPRSATSRVEQNRPTQQSRTTQQTRSAEQARPTQQNRSAAQPQKRAQPQPVKQPQQSQRTSSDTLPAGLVPVKKLRQKKGSGSQRQPQ
ncbi:MAG: FtsW/RodA/SpoVE family cell cycle protein [Rothia sp. (in: high G+C Gram-positive bacteria)]|nr:FtsW/RodA/SpoVE family cell cycle protein [Rothia sp. (in: high G+C Gram-positive bacteria)]